MTDATSFLRGEPRPALHRAAAAAPYLLGLASALILATALVFEHGFGYAPCKLCLYQRMPYYIALGLVLPPLVWKRRAMLPVLALAMLLFIGNAGIAGFHVGVEQGWWQGPATCSAALLPDDPAEALKQIQSAPLVRCDAVAWSFLGLSMAGWNLLLALGLAGFAGYAFMMHKRGEI